ncbi:MAG TPA: hypothetical protein VLO31_04320 [Cryobacterium sp.]|nr:hypothetical protein [Cryobacterium sp.]
MKLTALATLTLVGALALSGCATSVPETDTTPAATTTAAPADGSCTGVSVVVDFGALDAPEITDCVDTGTADDAETIAAGTVMETAGVATEGTVEWGDQVVCRVNGRPAADESIEVAGETPFTESCESMPAAAAYWALWVKPTADADWEYAQEGLGSLELAPGQSVGLVFTTGTETPTPGS